MFIYIFNIYSSILYNNTINNNTINNNTINNNNTNNNTNNNNKYLILTTMIGYHNHNVADIDKRDITAVAHIDVIEREILHKAKVLISQIADNPGLKPVLENYLHHIRERRENAARMLEYLQTLLLSLNTLVIPPPPTQLQQTRLKSKSYKGGGGDVGRGGVEIYSKLHSDQHAIMNELKKWRNVLAETSERLN
jgi:hypothetical protein